jgi:small subunit ribosomal protein S9
MDWTIAIGRRKTSVARVFIRPATKSGAGTFSINKRSFENYFPIEILRIKAMQPFTLLDKSATDFDIMVNVKGGGIAGQADAVRLGFSRNLVKMDEEVKSPLRQAGYMTRDPRMVERKKPGQPKARKNTQFSKR